MCALASSNPPFDAQRSDVLPVSSCHWMRQTLSKVIETTVQSDFIDYTWWYEMITQYIGRSHLKRTNEETPSPPKKTSTTKNIINEDRQRRWTRRKEGNVWVITWTVVLKLSWFCRIYKNDSLINYLYLWLSSEIFEEILEIHQRFFWILRWTIWIVEALETPTEISHSPFWWKTQRSQNWGS